MIPEQLADIKNFSPNSPLIKLDDAWLEQYKVEVFIKRDDLIDSKISGNKFRKLKYALSRYHQSNYSGIISFGGAWSNHLHALAAVAEKFTIPTVAIVRGQKPEQPSSTLNDILQSGITIQYVTRSEYRDFRALSEQGKLQQHPLFNQWPNYMLIPEGGCSIDALKGVAEITTEDTDKFDAIYLACGTGATLAGLSLGLANKPDTQLIGIAALRAGTSLQQNVQRLLTAHGQAYSENWSIDDHFHFGGFAKINPELVTFINDLYDRCGLITEPIYTGKTLFALYQHIQQGRFPENTKIMMLHTGGLQGLRGFQGKGVEQLINAAGFG